MGKWSNSEIIIHHVQMCKAAINEISAWNWVSFFAQTDLLVMRTQPAMRTDTNPGWHSWKSQGSNFSNCSLSLSGHVFFFPSFSTWFNIKVKKNQLFCKLDCVCQVSSHVAWFNFNKVNRADRKMRLFSNCYPEMKMNWPHKFICFSTTYTTEKLVFSKARKTCDKVEPSCSC